MPIHVLDLQPGDRVVLNCPKAHGQAKKEAQFRGIYKSIAEAMASLSGGAGGVDIIGPASTPKFRSGKEWAGFLLQRSDGPAGILEYPGGGAIPGLADFEGPTDLCAAFAIEPDGSLREEEGRRVFIERRMRMGQG